MTTSKKIVRYVLVIHAIFLGIILFGSPLTPPRKQKKNLIVKTVMPKVATHVVQATPTVAAVPPPQKIAAVAPPKQSPKPLAAKKPAPPIAKKKEPAIADKQVKKKEAPQPQKKNPPDNRAKISDALKQELQKSIAQIEGKHQSSMPSKKPTPIQLSIDSVDQASSDSEFLDQMIAYLHQSLHLPEFGEVKIQLTLRQDGSIAKLVILKSESEKNRRYLESNLPRLHLPSLDGALAKKPEQTFVLTFCNEI